MKYSSKQCTVRSRAISKGISKKKQAWSKVFSKETNMLESGFEGKRKHARAVISSAQWPRSTLEQ